MKSWKKPTKEIIKEVLQSVTTENDRNYFFSKLKNPKWLEILRDEGYFSNPPKTRVVSTNEIQYPYWPELNYLVNVSIESPEIICDIVLNIPKSNNPRIYEGMIEIALKIDLKLSKILYPKIKESLTLVHHFNISNYLELIQYWTNNYTLDECLNVISELIGFKSDVNSENKRQKRKEKHDDINTILEPTICLRNYKYKEILKDGVRPLSDLAPLQTSKVLIRIVLDMIYLSTHKLSNGEWPEQDYSEMWCRRLDKPSSGNNSVKEDLVHSLTYSCEQVYLNEEDAIEELDKLLRKYHWRLFKRLRQYLYAKFPNKQNLPWIREFILNHEDYNRWEHHYEFQLMIKNACDHFGFKILENNEVEQIFKKILEGPPRRDYQASKYDTIPDEKYLEFQKLFHLKQLVPFKPILTGKYKDYFEKLSEGNQDEINDESYQQFGNTKAGFITQKSPISAEEIKKSSDEELLKLINDWDDEHHDKDDWLNEISIEGLAETFQKLVQDEIILDLERMKFWVRNDEIKRPIYVTSIVKAMNELLSEGKLTEIKLCIEFFQWIILKNTIRNINSSKPRDHSAENPDWDSSKRAVIDIIIKMLKKNDDLPIALRSDISELLTKAFEMSDYRLDESKKVFLSENDPFSEAINNTRSKVIEALIVFGIWIKKYHKDDNVLEVMSILNKRLSEKALIPLTPPEFAMLGVQFNNLYSFDKTWARSNKNLIFPKLQNINWQAAFSSYIRYSRPYKVIFEILKDDFDYAIENFNLLTGVNGFGTDAINQFGKHIFTYFLLGEFDLENESLIIKYYDVTKGNIDLWSNLFCHVGYILNDNNDLKGNLVNRIMQFLEWRLIEKETKELSCFYIWLETSSIEPSWILGSYSQILDILDKGDENLSSAIKPLSTKLNGNEELVVECFKKVTGLLEKGNFVYIAIDEAKEILRVGLKHPNSKVNENAVEARDNLLKIGRFDFKEI